MKQYLIAMHQPVGEPPPPDFLEPIMRELGTMEQEMKAAGVWVFSGGLHGPDASTVVRASGQDAVVTDGPYVEGKEHLGGFTIVRAQDLDEALRWAKRAARITGLPIEVRPFQGEVEG